MVSLASQPGAMLPPPTPPPMRPTFGFKRDSSYLDTDDEANLSLSTKKLRVAFDPNVDIRIVEDWTEKSLDLVREEVRLGIEGHVATGERKDDTKYLKLLTLLEQEEDAEDAPSGRLLKRYLLAVEAMMSSLGDCGKLVAALLDISWLGRDDEFVALFTRLLSTLATAHAKYIPSIMEKLVEHFARLPGSLGKLPGEVPVPRTKMFRRVHTAIKTLLVRIPSATGALTRALRSEFPNDLTTTRPYIQYQKHMLRIGDYAPEIQPEVLAILTQRLVSIDVQIQIDVEEFEEESAERLLQPQGASKPTSLEHEDSDDSDDDSVSESEMTIAEEEQRLKEIKSKVDKMDLTMDLLFEYYGTLIKETDLPLQSGAYQQLLSHFSTFILPNRTRHAQFLVFRYSQLRAQHANVFATQCMQVLLDINRSVSHRLHACAYLASFISRGASLEGYLVRDTFNALCNQLEAMRKRYEPGCRGPDKRAYAIYYAVAQALLYIFCFRWQDLAIGPESPEPGDEDASIEDLVAEGRELEWLDNVKEVLQKNIHSPLNPLKVCSPVVVSEFGKLAHHLHFLYIFTILETNKRVRLGNSVRYDNSIIGKRETAIDRKLGEAHLQLEAYFPFDPYQLPQSRKWVEANYREWTMPAGMRREEEESEAEEDSDEESLIDESDPIDDLPAADTVSISS